MWRCRRRWRSARSGSRPEKALRKVLRRCRLSAPRSIGRSQAPFPMTYGGLRCPNPPRPLPGVVGARRVHCACSAHSAHASQRAQRDGCRSQSSCVRSLPAYRWVAHAVDRGSLARVRATRRAGAAIVALRRGRPGDTRITSVFANFVGDPHRARRTVCSRAARSTSCCSSRSLWTGRQHRPSTSSIGRRSSACCCRRPVDADGARCTACC